MNVRHVEGREDVRGVVRVNGLGWRAAYEGLLPEDVLQDVPIDPDEEVLDEWQDGLRENHEGILVAVDDEGTVRGFVDFRWGDAETKSFVGESEADLKAIYVDPDCWGQGIGAELLEAGLDLLPEWVEAVRLEMLAGNDVGARFYEARGFERTESSECEIGEDLYPTDVYTLVLA